MLFREFLKTINEDNKRKVSSASDLKKIIKSRSAKGNKVDFNDLDVSAITDFSYIFENYKYEPLVETWDVSNAKTMDSMFLNCYNFNCDISNWDVSKCENFSRMFYNCEKFNQDLSKWNVSKGKNFASMFFNCYDFNNDLSKWNVSNAKDFSFMFSNCSKFNCNLSGWTPKNLENWNGIFTGAKKINSKSVDGWKVSNKSMLSAQEKGTGLSPAPKWEVEARNRWWEKYNKAAEKERKEYDALQDDPLWPGKKIPRGGRFTGD